MITLTVPSGPTYELRFLVSDMNGTLSLDGQVRPSTLERLRILSEQLEVFVVTADTFGTARHTFAQLPLTIMKLEGDTILQKRDFIRELGPEFCVAMGNGHNDHAMLEIARLSICVIGREGAAVPTLNAADIAVIDPDDALDLLLQPDRLRATLRG